MVDGFAVGIVEFEEGEVFAQTLLVEDDVGILVFLAQVVGFEFFYEFELLVFELLDDCESEDFDDGVLVFGEVFFGVLFDLELFLQLQELGLSLLLDVDVVIGVLVELLEVDPAEHVGHHLHSLLFDKVLQHLLAEHHHFVNNPD